MKYMFAILAASLFSGACFAKDRDFLPVPAEGQEVSYESGVPYLSAKTARFQLAVAYRPEDRNTALIVVGVTNMGDEPVTVSDSSIKAFSDGVALEVVPYEDRLKSLARQEMWGAIATGIAAAGNSMNAANAGYQTHQGTYRSTTRATVYGPAGTAYGTASTTGNYYGSSYNATAAEIAKANADAKNQAMLSQQAEASRYARESLQGRALKAQTLGLGQAVVGDVEIGIPKRNKKKPAEFVVVVETPDHPVEFLFREKQ